jgi:hypothetical protein
MAVALYDISVSAYLQSLGAVAGFLEKGRALCDENGIDLADVVETRLYPDMLPFRFQLLSVVHHSLGALRGIQAGVFKPPPSAPDLDYAALQQRVTEARSELEAMSADEVNALEGKSMVFEIGDRQVPFVAEDFVLSFSLPNLHFHAATAYDILRMRGVAIGKRDFMGQLRMRTA